MNNWVAVYETRMVLEPAISHVPGLSLDRWIHEWEEIDKAPAREVTLARGPAIEPGRFNNHSHTFSYVSTTLSGVPRFLCCIRRKSFPAV
jgi:hypothetical protein